MNQPLQISVDLVSGIAGGIDLPIDGILSAAWMRKNRPDLYYGAPPIKIADMVDAELPLLRLSEDDN